MSAPILVTGASRGIGAAVTRALVAEGVPIVGVHRRQSEASEAITSELSHRLTLIRADLATDEGIQTVLQALGDVPLAGAVLAAGVTVRRSFVAADLPGEDAIRDQIRTDLEGPLVLVRGLLRAGVVRDGSSIVFLSSNLTRRAIVDKVPYTAAKGGLEAATRALAHELGPRSIRVNAVAPGLLRTDMASDLDEAALADYAKTVPLRRVGEAADVVPAITFLLGPQASYITGQVLDVDGGWGA